MKNKSYSIIAIIFFFFFASPALSPAFGGKTIYIYWLIPFLDFRFVRYFIDKCWMQVKVKWIFIAGVVAIMAFAWDEVFFLVKVLSIFLCVVYLNYCKEKNLFCYFYWGININIVIAIIQFVLYYIDERLAYLWGPSNVSEMIWGKYATATFTNFFPTIGSFVRVCGWSREAGFFASLIIVSIVYYLFWDKEKKPIQLVLLAIGFFVSFSKMSLLLIPLILIILFRDVINKIPVPMGIFIYFFATVLASFFLHKMGYFVPINESIAHRFIWYSAVWFLPMRMILFGYGDYLNVREMLIHKYPDIYVLDHANLINACGYSAIIQKFGLVGLIVSLVTIYFLNWKTTAVCFFLIATFNVDPFTSTSFVIMAYWMANNMKVRDR